MNGSGWEEGLDRGGDFNLLDGGGDGGEAGE